MMIKYFTKTCWFITVMKIWNLKHKETTNTLVNTNNLKHLTAIRDSSQYTEIWSLQHNM